jgi:MFS family permease
VSNLVSGCIILRDMVSIRQIFSAGQPVPEKYRRNFNHLYWDIAWWGLLNGSVLVFLAIYASRIGASTFQLGLLTASPALVNLLITFPAGTLLRRTPTQRAVRLSALITRLFYLLLIPLPLLFTAPARVWIIIAITLMMSIPGTFIAIIFNAFFAEVIPPGMRGQVAGTRNALFAATSMLTSLVVGLILTHTPFATGYMLVFAIGFAGAMMSTLHLFLIRVPPSPLQTPVLMMPQVKHELEEVNQAPLRSSRLSAIRLDVVKSPFGRVLLMMGLFQLAIFIISPIVPKYQVNVLELSDGTISLGSAVFWVVHFVGSLRTRNLASRIGFQRQTGYGIFFTAAALTVFAFSFENWIYIAHQVISGIGWALVSGAVVNYVLENVPVDDRAPYLAWYNLANNAAVLVSGLFAPMIAGWIGLFPLLMVAVGLRLLVGYVILRWGKAKTDA